MTRKATTLYFPTPGRANTDETLSAALDRAMELGIDHLVVASTSGSTGLKMLDLTRQRGYQGKLIVVGEHMGFKEAGQQLFTAENRRTLEEAGATVFIGTHSLSSVARSFRLKWGGIDMLETIAEVLRRFSAGVKVCVEIMIMAADAGLIPTDRDVVCVGGSGGGSDSAVVLRPANQNRFFEFKMKEIIAMPS